MGNEPTQGSGTGQEQGQGDGYSSLVEDFLKDIPEADKNVVQQYVKGWDDKVQQQFTKRADEIKAYKELGEVDEIKAAKEVYRLINEAPDYVLRELARELKIELPTATPPGSKPAESQTPPASNQVPLQGLPKEVQEELQQLRDLVKQVATVQVSSNQQQKEKEEAEALDSYLNELRTNHGEFDEDYVLAKMANGIDGVEAVKAFHALTGGGTPKVKTPPPLAGGGVIPTQAQKVTEMSRKETVDLVASVLAASKGQ